MDRNDQIIRVGRDVFDLKLSDGELRVYMAIRYFAQKSRWEVCTASRESIGELADRGIRTVANSIASLKSQGLIDVYSGKDRWTTSCIYAPVNLGEFPVRFPDEFSIENFINSIQNRVQG